MKKMKVGFHGEVIAVSITKLPENLKTISPANGYVIVAESETTGNHHRVAVADKKVDFYEKDGTLYMKNLESVEIGCVVEERHDTEILPAGIWEFRKALEFDPVEEVLRQAAD